MVYSILLVEYRSIQSISFVYTLAFNNSMVLLSNAYIISSRPIRDYSGINVPLVAVCNVPPVAQCNVPPQKWLQ